MLLFLIQNLLILDHKLQMKFSMRSLHFWSLPCVHVNWSQLELQSTGPSTPSVILDDQGNVIDSRDGGGEPIQFVFEEIGWTSEISREEAARRLDVTFYPFKKVTSVLDPLGCSHLAAAEESRRCCPPPSPQVTYLPFSEAFQRAEAESKLVHSILLWGALDDQSCWGQLVFFLPWLVSQQSCFLILEKSAVWV